MKNKKFLFIFLVILVFSAFLRLYRLSDVPPGVNRDEASIGYTAFSLLKTGSDEYGNHLPLSFQSFGDWKLPFYIYTTTIFVKVFGLSEIAIRLPSALFGIVTVGLTFLLVNKLFNNKTLALLTMFLVGISPWHLQLSRVASESNTAVFLILLAVILFLNGLKKAQWLVPSSFLFALTYYTYAGNHVFTTIFVVGLIVIFRSKIPKNIWTYISIVLFLALSGFIFYHTLFIADKTKLSGISIYGDPSIVHSKIELLRDEHLYPKKTFTKIIHNSLLFGGERFIDNYMNSFSPDFLFIKGGENRAHNIQNFGNMYAVEGIFLFLGFAFLITAKKRKEDKLVLFWFLIAPIAASITKDAPHTTRMFAIFPILPLVTALGMLWIIGIVKRNKVYKKLTIFLIVALFVLNFSIYMDRYYVHFPRDEVEYWGYGYKKLTSVTEEKQYTGKKIVISKPENSPYIFLLFYLKYDPYTFQKNVVRYPPTSDGFYHVKSFGNFEFRDINWSSEIKDKNKVLVDFPLHISDFTKKQHFPTQEILAPNNDIMYYVVEVGNKKIIQ